MNFPYMLMSALASLFILVMLIFVGCERQPSASKKPAEATSFSQMSSTLLADTTGGHKLFTLETPSSKMTPNYNIVFSKAGNAVVYKSERNGEYAVVLNGAAGKYYQEVSDMTFSPNGKRFAYIAQSGGKSRMVVDNHEEMDAEAVGAPIFSPDSKHLMYYFKSDSKWHLVVDGRKGEGSLSIYDQFFSSDSSKVVSFEQVDSDENSPYCLLKIRDLKLKLLASKRLSARNRVYNPDRSRMAAIEDFRDKKRVVEVEFNNIEVVKVGQPFDDVSLLSFGSDGVTAVFIAMKAGKRFLVINGKESPLPDGEILEPPAFNALRDVAGVIVATSDGYEVCLVNERGLQKKRYKEAAFLKLSKDGAAYVHVALNGKQQQYVVNGKPGPSFDKALPPMFTPDGKYLVCRVRQDGKRFLIVLDLDGNLVRKHPDFEMVFEPVFSGDGKSVGYGVKEGARLAWKVEKLP